MIILNPISIPAGALTRNSHQLTVDPAAFNHLAVAESAVLTINYSVSDGTTTTANTATITITGANDAPTVSAISSTKSEDDSSYVINLLSDANAADPDSSDSLSVTDYSASGVDQNNTAITIPDGALTLNGAELTIDPTAFDDLALNESATLTVNYNVNDGTTTTANTATITITGANDAPIVAAINTSTSEDAAPYTLNLLSTSSDPDSSNALSIENYSASAVDGNGRTSPSQTAH